MSGWIEKKGYATCLMAEVTAAGRTHTQTHLIRFSSGKFCHYHKATTEFFYITGGQGRVRIDDRVVKLAPGTSLVIEPYQVHTFLNDSPQQYLEAVMVKVNPNENDTYQLVDDGEGKTD